LKTRDTASVAARPTAANGLMLAIFFCQAHAPPSWMRCQNNPGLPVQSFRPVSRDAIGKKNTVSLTYVNRAFCKI
jgi:hypothetical protein